MHHYNCPQAVYAEGRAAPRLRLAMQLCPMLDAWQKASTNEEKREENDFSFGQCTQYFLRNVAIT
ncbi:hypothetical protein V1478_012355 [Vespula squamosa]|uniref:Uncharacterized protein n=1 Tax=Vespula squamosa TaxID=30214 RepID=A0ABD2ACX7_VESSQ